MAFSTYNAGIFVVNVLTTRGKLNLARIVLHQRFVSRAFRCRRSNTVEGARWVLTRRKVCSIWLLQQRTWVVCIVTNNLNCVSSDSFQETIFFQRNCSFDRF